MVALILLIMPLINKMSATKVKFLRIEDASEIASVRGGDMHSREVAGLDFMAGVGLDIDGLDVYIQVLVR